MCEGSTLGAGGNGRGAAPLTVASTRWRTRERSARRTATTAATSPVVAAIIATSTTSMGAIRFKMRTRPGVRKAGCAMLLPVKTASWLAAATLLACSRSPAPSSSDAGGGPSAFAPVVADYVGFEGEADVRIDIPTYDSPLPVPMYLHLKGAKMRTEYGAGTHVGEIQIRDEREKKAWLLHGATHTYTESPIVPSRLPPSRLGRPRGTKTGKTDTVAGYACDVWQYEPVAGFPSIELCVAHGLTFLAAGLGPLGVLGASDWSDATSDGGFILRTRDVDATTGKEVSRVEVTRLEKKPQPDALFEIPKGYTRSPTY